ncbi:MAG: SulP family inorganic anion transporter [Nitrospirae bacterium]|nr:SulP family inorganic anion transporter [Nitrospirota bacterium]MBF0591539.1 SulP family inorganic anion transporter [Nitrospirota bacterium]
MDRLKRVLPFLQWLKGYNGATLRADLIAGITVALVLVPQSMAYAQLAGLPAYYGLYAAFLPPLTAALFGSSRQLATGPVAVVSLMSAASLEPLATKGGEAFIAYSVLLALSVGIFQLSLGIFRLGFVVNFLSHPAVIGFTNAAALIIATSQLGNLFGVNVDSAEHHYETVYNVIMAAIEYTHWPTLALACLSFIIMIGLRKINPRLPNVLIAVALTTFISWLTSYEEVHKGRLSEITTSAVVEKMAQYNDILKKIEDSSTQRSELTSELNTIKGRKGTQPIDILEMNHKIQKLNASIEELKQDARLYRKRLRSYKFEAVKTAEAGMLFYTRDEVSDSPATVRSDSAPATVRSDSDKIKEGKVWHLRVGNKPFKADSLVFNGGGAVLGAIPKGMPAFALPKVDLNILLTIFPTAIIISLLGFMEAISIAKAMATRTGQRLDPNQELIGQGLANIVGSMGKSYAVSGSFSRSAVNLQAGAITGLSSVFTSALVLITLMFFTPLLYHLPQSVLASVIMMAVIGLINVRGILHTWHAQRYDGITALITFAFTIAFAPHLDKGIMAGVAFSLGHYLYRNMKPPVAVLSRHEDGTLRNTDLFGLNRCEHVNAISFDGSLFFANTSYLEDQILSIVAEKPNLRHIIICGEGINEVDASGEETLGILVDRLRDRGIDVSFVGLKDQVLDVVRRTGLYKKIGEDHIFRTEAKAIEVIHAVAHQNSSEKDCPLIKVCYLNK